jgi:hypothetical protein
VEVIRELGDTDMGFYDPGGHFTKAAFVIVFGTAWSGSGR